MINELGNSHEETVISNNESGAETNVQTFVPKSKILEVKWVYK